MISPSTLLINNVKINLTLTSFFVRCTHSSIRNGLVGMVGRTPLVRLNKISDETGCDILAKAEMCNGGGSVKDRAALFLIQDAIRKGQLKPGGTVVEGTAGNTGIGLAHMCLSMGFKCVIFMPNNQSQEKIDILRTLGADVTTVPVCPWDNPNNYNHHARRFSESLKNAVWTNQFDNRANRLAHIETTGPEIWEETQGKVDAVTFGTGTGGTLSGVGTYLKEKNRHIKVVLADPQGSVLYNYFKHGKLERTPGDSITEGIGQGRLTENLKGSPIDDACVVMDTEAVNMTFKLLDEEGLLVGSTSGLNVASAHRLAKEMGRGHTIVTCLCDSGHRYHAKLFNKDVLRKRGLLQTLPEQYHKYLHGN
ncbi:cysteine synthase 1 [Biomphalaria pfeifferi]|uniref:Cysteine synthase 1 n=1 Tax=Biomphalaria pfeifferi TaxID=112525 RepID=A0AAD8BVJ3_BIOPF|nr:cysteine synthase 1 [Biomphalaria pfeifferi]